MEEQLNQQNAADLQTKLLTHDHRLQKGGMKTMPFIIVNEAFQKIAISGLFCNMIFYLMDVYHMEAVPATTVIYIWSGFSSGLSVFGAFISDSYLGRFRVIAIGSISTLLVPQLAPSSCHEPETGCSPPTPTQLGYLFSSLGLISLGTGCTTPCSLAFGADQLKHHNNQRLIDSYFNLYYASGTISALIGSTVMVYIQDHFGWRVGFAVPTIFMFCSVLMFMLGSSLYVKVEVNQSPYSGFVQVLIFAFKNRRIRLLPDDRHNHSNEMDRVELTDNLRFLNKACVVRDTDSDHAGPSARSVPTVENVESLKSFIRIIPVWSSGIILFTNLAQNFPILQANKMNRNITSWLKIPAASFVMFVPLTITIFVALYDRLLIPFLAKFTHEPRGLHPKTRMGIGVILSIIAMVVSAIVESIRRNLANTNTNTPVGMSAMWLVPQFVLLGLTDAFNVIGQMEFYYSELPKSMASSTMAVIMVSATGAAFVSSLLTNIVDSVTSQEGGISWLSSDINEGHVDYYYWLLSFLNLLNFSYYLTCCVHRRFS